MSSATPVHAQAEAVEELAHAVQSFGDQQQRNLESARASLSRHTQQAVGEVQARRQRVDQARRATAAADAALASCRENCGGLAQAVAAARRTQADAEQSLARARRAAETLEQASARLAAATRLAERVTAEHGRAALASCQELAERLRSFLRHAASTVEVMSTIAHAASQAGMAMPPTSILAPPPSDTTIVARAESAAADQNQLWADASKLRDEERSGDWVGRTD